MRNFINKYFLLLIIFVIIFIVIEVVLKQQVEEYAIYENNEKLENILTNQKALHTYIEDMQKPVIYNLKKSEKLYHEFFDPNILSFTYIARNIHAIENKIEQENNRTQKYYKLASVNPRNDLNIANDFEKELIERFNTSELKDYKKVIEEDGKKFLYYAKPVGENKQSCMKCHSTPDKAPTEMLKMYGDKKGFYEKIGDIRAIISIKIPLEHELKNASKYYNIVSAIIFVSLVFIYLIIFYLMKKLDKKQEKLQLLVHVDQLTGCLNRRAFEANVKREIELAKRSKNSFSLITFDIDHFKNINDTYGHQAGDEILVEVCEMITQQNREYDKFYRIGGEEFMILCPSTDIKDALNIAQRLRIKIQEHNFKYDYITISLGVTEYNSNDSFEELYKKVDNALYLSKEKGRNRVEAG
ncbi:diguanylate cyclase [bacterium]|nr:diguanylate cyclase [bacterium]MBU1990412.1 diguanylate cyclase [bacterium]